MRKISLALTICLLGLIGLPANAAKKLEDNNSDSAGLEDTFITNKPKATKLTTKTATKPETKTATATTISGAFGITLGSFFDTKAPGVTFDAETDIYHFSAPQKPFRKWFNYGVLITPVTHKICSISAYFVTNNEAAFNAEKEVVLSLLKNKYPDYKNAQMGGGDSSELFRYMDQSRCFVVLSFREINDETKALRLNYTSQNLIDCALKELSENKAQDGDSL